MVEEKRGETYQQESSQRPKEFDKSAFRSERILEIFQWQHIKDTDAKYSDNVQCPGFRKFCIYLDIDSTGAPTTLHYEVQFLNHRTSKWYTYKQGLFAALFYEDTDVADKVQECFSGDCDGREMRVKITGAGCTAAAYFSTSVGVEFYN